jgi:hypothetical protein
MRAGRPYRQVFALSGWQACDIVRADDSNAGEFLPVETYEAFPV